MFELELELEVKLGIYILTIYNVLS